MKIATSGFKPRNAHRWMPLLLIVTSLVVAGALAEVSLRLFFHNALALADDERNLMYRYDATLGWFPVENSERQVTGARTITAIHNSEGFRGPEHVQDGKPVILFLGDSFTWGVDAEESERFTDKLQARHPEWRIYNFGISGYGTDQEYLLLQKRFDEYKPRVVFLIFCTDNDDSDNRWNMRHGGYYKPYCTVTNSQLSLNGIPVPRAEKVFYSEHQQLRRSYVVRLIIKSYFKLTAPPPLESPNPTGPIIRDMQKYLTSKHTIFLIGLTHSHPNLEEFLRHFNIPYVDLSDAARYSAAGAHWTPIGHDYVCEKVDALLKAHFIEEQPAVNR